jgi:hypothetical protein
MPARRHHDPGESGTPALSATEWAGAAGLFTTGPFDHNLKPTGNGAGGLRLALEPPGPLRRLGLYELAQ